MENYNTQQLLRRLRLGGCTATCENLEDTEVHVIAVTDLQGNYHEIFVDATLGHTGKERT